MASIVTKESAVLEGAFLSADKLCRPASLSSVQKAEWNQVGKPILQAVRQICRQDEPDSQPNLNVLNWKKRIICVVWLKLLCTEAEEDVEETWRENSLFCLQNSLPEVNSVVLLEFVKSTAAAQIFANFLLHLPLPSICTELKRLAEHVRSDPKREEDVQFFLDVWRELWKGQHELKVREGECIEMMFASQFARLSSKSCSVSPQAAKRLKLDAPGLPALSANTDVLHILLHTLKDMTDQVSSADLCFQSLSVSLDALYTSFLIDQEVILSIKEKLCILCKFISTGGKNENITAELIHEAQRNLRASHLPSQFQPNMMKLAEALKIITELAQCWQGGNLLNICGSSVSSNSMLQLEQSVQRVLTALDEVKHPTDVTEKNILEHLLTSLAFPAIESSPEVHAKVITTIIHHRLEDYKNVAVLFATETSWIDCDERWMDCLEKNQAAFQQHRILVSLSSTLMSTLHEGGSDVGQNRKLMKIIADIFSALSLEDKNKALAAMVRLSSRGFFGGSVPSAVTQGFEQELNMAFNCIIQGGGGAPAAVSQGTLTTAVSLVARVAFQNPEAALRSCCHSAVFNKGAFSIVGQILQHLPGLRGQSGVKDEEERKYTEGKKHVGRNAVRASSLLCRCLEEMLQNKSLSANDKEQFVKFVGLLMLPDTHEEQRRSFLSPEDVVNNLVLPNLSAEGHSSVNTELGLQLLHIALSMDIQELDPSCHWVLKCSPVPLLYVLAQLYNQASRCWDQPQEGTIHLHFMTSKELLVSILTRLGQVVGSVVAAVPSKWSRALFWLYNKMEELDWTVRFYLKPVWGQHFKNEVPSSLLAVCDLPEQDWSGLDLPQYGQGTGLLAWLECCCVSDSLKSTMLSCLSLDQRQPDHVNMFSKGLLVALTQILPWCSISQWTRLLSVLRELITSARLNVPFSLEYVDYLPLLDLRQFSCELRLSVLLLRVFQLLCGSSCSHWLSASGCSHVSRLYAHAVRDIINSVKAKLLISSPGTVAGSASISLKPPASIESSPCHISFETPKMYEHPLTDSGNSPRVSRESHLENEGEAAPSQEVLFVLSQLFCHVQHIQVMIPGGQSESLFLCTLEILSHYEATMAAFPDSCGPLECYNTRHFFSTITDNLDNQEMKAVLQQKIAQLVSSAA